MHAISNRSSPWAGAFLLAALQGCATATVRGGYCAPPTPAAPPGRRLDGPTTSETYPPVIWTYLTRAAFSNGRREPIRGRIVGRWRQFQQVEDPATAAMLFGSGGSYDVDSLRLRAAMLDEVKAEVELARQDLAALAAELLR